MNTIVNFYTQNQDMINFVVVVIVWLITHRQLAINFASKKASTLMFAAEKGSTDLLLKYGQEKMDWVVSEGYRLMPSIVRPFVSIDTFRKEAQKLFDAAKAVAILKAPQPIQTVMPTVTPVVETVPVEAQITV